MNRDELLYLAPYLTSLFVTLGVFAYTWKHRRVRGAGIYLWFVGGQTLTIFGFIFELITPTIDIKILWDIFQWITETVVVILAFFIFVIEFTERKFKYPRLVWSLILILPLTFVLLLLTDSVYHLIYRNPHLGESYPFKILEYDYTTFVYIYAILFIYLLPFYGIGLLVQRAFKSNGTYRAQFLILAIGFSIPVLVSILALFSIKIGPQRDISPLTFAAGNIIVALGLFRYGLFDLIPIAREKIMENMADPMIVLDIYDRVVDINQAALKKVNKKYSEIEGSYAKMAFTEWPVIQRHLESIKEQKTSITIKSKGETSYYELSVSPLADNKKRLLGHVIVVHDITRHKTLEHGYKQLSEELEERVRERTEELRNIAERYRAVVENQTEFIVRWKPDGIRTFVNEAYCRYFGLTPEQALSTSFMPLVVEEDRRAIEEKTSRLIAGITKTETEIHRVFKPDGTIGWQEWTDQAICDEAGNLIEFQSVGRDVTKQKKAEERILRLNRLYITISQINQTIVHAPDRDSLFNEICRDAIDHGQFRMAWIGMFDETGEEIKPIVFAGEELGYLENLSIKYHDKILSGGPTGTAIREGHCVISQDISSDPSMIPWREEALKRGYRSSAAVPIREQGRVVGALTVYTDELNGFDSENEELLEQIGQDVSFALDSINGEVERKRAEENLADAYDTTLEGWARALELRDKETEGHSRRVTATTLAVARVMGFNEEELVHIRRGSILHDIGKMGISDDILRKAGPLTEEERQIVLKHPETAYGLLKQISFLEKALEIPYCHHEKWDGTGYPRGLKGDEIPLSARIFAMADVWDALSSDRPYRKAWDLEKITQYLIGESGRHFDPHVVKIFLEMIEQGKI